MGEVIRFVRRLITVVLGSILLLMVILAGYLGWGYYEIRRDFAAREKQAVTPTVDEGSVSEAGYIMESHESSCIKIRKKRVIWFVKIPSANKIYTCDWQHGFAGFRKDDTVILIHREAARDWSAASTGYVIGKGDKIKDRSSCVRTYDVLEDPGDAVD